MRENLEQYERLLETDEDAFEQPTTTRRELWAYYCYYNADSGVGPVTYGQALFQSALSAAGHDPAISPVVPGNCTTRGCVLPWGSGTRSVASVVLIANGVCFAVMSFLFVWLGSAADYGSFGRWLLLAATLVNWVFQFAFMSVRGAGQWKTAMGLYIVNYIAYGSTLVFFAAIFPRLARYMPHVRKAREEDLKDGRISQDEYDAIESLERNHISNVSTAHSNVGYVMTLAVSLSVLLPMRGNSYANNWALFLSTAYSIVFGVWWFIFQQKRPGPRLPRDSSYATIGWKQVFLALREIRHLPQTFIYLVGFFLLADGLNTTSTLISIIQNDQVSFSFLQITYLGLAQALCSVVSTLGFWRIQQRFNISTKRMFMVTNAFSVLLPFYGMLGLWTRRVGFHRIYDFWLYNVVFGLFQAPYYAYAQTMMSEVTPRGYEGMFFGLFGITNRASSVIGPNVVQAIVNASGNNWLGFPFLVGLCTAAVVVIWFVDVEEGREACRRFVDERKMVRVAREGGEQAEELVVAVSGRDAVR
ncbi:uncharacterized protein K452DRAFT_217809 [Aplosporella prunicola CBS 121167]|uniref:Autophagy-related protein n=1 Tax=Aplosporella prunicola CBS 121167 TaxID=1176127 RepID=A0A6A6BWA1_9PEZI|nr:uncharacterized protein K452DRAFT_217809 [Aplosporella prunicola CBS 121167]KAF2147575.1 hypothetical protein K452DRAFT_217809 [Aplosporella prunicola CBS 121167]